MKIFEEKTDEEHPMTISELIDELAKEGISAERKSLYRDIEQLKDFGLDIVSERGKSYVYYLGSRIFELPELKLLVDAVQSSKFITHKKSTDLIRKIESLASEHEAKQLQRQVYVANRIKNANESIYYNVDRIHNAIGENSKISFKYFDWTMNKEKQFRREGAKYTVSPWALTWDDENYYLIAYETETDMVKHYRVDKMMYIDALHEKRDGKKRFAEFDMGIYSKKFFGMFNGSEETVTLRCDKSLVGVIIDRFGKNITLFADDDDHFKVNINVAVSPMFFGWVFNFGDKMEIISPKGVIERFKEMARGAINRYE
jgi:predicted DNA-binding transcriptional regulator YafY